MMETVAGIQINEEGVISIQPHLSGLKWVKATCPTSKGVIEVEHILQKDGTTVSKIKK